MLRFKSLSLSNVICFDEATLDLDPPTGTTTFVMGRNMSARAAERRNGAGKTLLVSPLAHLAFGDPTGLSTNLSRHSLLARKGARIEWLLRDSAGSEWQLVQKRSGTTKSGGARAAWQIARDGNDMQARTVQVASDLISRLLPMSEDEARTVVYMDSRAPSPVLHGTPVQRQTYLTNLFRADVFDHIRVWFADRLKTMDTDAASVRSLEYAMEPLLWTDAFDAESAQQEVEKLKSLRSSLHAKVRSAEAETVLADIRDRTRKDMLTASFYSVERHRKVRQAVNAWDMHQAAVKGHERARKQRAAWSKGIAAAVSGLPRSVARSLPRSTSSEKFRNAVAGALSKLDYDMGKHSQVSDKLARLGDRIEKLERDAERADQLDPDGKLRRDWTLAALETERLFLVEKAASLNSRIEKLEDHIADVSDHGEHCPLCGAELDADTAREILDETRAQSKATRRKLGEVAKITGKVKQLAKLNLVSPQQRDELRTRQRRLRSIAESMAHAGETKKALQRVAKLVGEMPPKVAAEPPESPPGDPDELAEQLAELRKQQAALVRVKAVRSELDKAEKLPPVKQLKRRADRLSDRLERLTEALARREDRLAEWRAARKTLAGLRVKAETAAAALSDRELVEKLVDAYGRNGLKLEVLRRAAAAVEDNLNKYSPLLFAERMSFRIVVDENTTDITAVRQNGQASDVRFLSGAESRMFSLLWLIGVLPLIPDSRRVNLAVLDEFESGVDDMTRKMLVDEYLPRLNELVPHVVFVTPGTVEDGPGRRLVTVVKEKGVSRLVEGAV